MTDTILQGDPLRINTEYLPSSRSAGVLYGFFFLLPDQGLIDFTKSTFLALNRSSSPSYELPFSLSNGVYFVYGYGIEEDGLLLSGDVLPHTTASQSGTSESNNYI